MDGRGDVEGDQRDEDFIKCRTISELIDACCPYYMAMGLSYNNYWYGDPGLVKYYKAAHEIQCEMRHAQAHLDGLYTYIAFSKVMAAAFSKEGGNFSYPEKPLPRTLKESDAAQLKILQAQQDRAKMYLTMYATQNKKKEG